ncbi:MAG: DUF3575 domain-containing protein [Staphylococcus sp.]|nr:DUF3575 domain-containing protein [Staphylococcus sp.]
MVDFRANVTRIDPGYSSNATRIEQIISLINNLDTDTTQTVTSVLFCGTASPEGSYDLNRHLAAERLASLERFIRERVNIPDSIISRDDCYIPWEYLRQRVAESDLPYKEAVVSIIDEEPVLVNAPWNGQPVDRRIVRLRQLDNARVWDELYHLYFDKMRNASVVVTTYREDKKEEIIPVTPPEQPALPEPTAEVIPEPEIETVPEPEPTPVEEQSQPECERLFHMDIYTNMLFDALAIPNIGVEFYLGKNWSIGANWMYAWWSCDRRHRYWRTYGGEINTRYWFGKAAHAKPLTGHHVGLYGHALTYDFELGGKGYMCDRWTWGVGLAYGYSMPVSRHFNIDFTVGFGYAGGEYKKYNPEDGCYVWESTHRLNWFGPTKAEVSLVWLIDGCSKKMGGVR